MSYETQEVYFSLACLYVDSLLSDVLVEPALQAVSQHMDYLSVRLLIDSLPVYHKTGGNLISLWPFSFCLVWQNCLMCP